MRVLYVGHTYVGSNAQSLRRAFERLGHEVRTVAQDPWFALYARRPHLRTWKKLGGSYLHRHVAAFQREVVRAAREFHPEILFAARALWLGPETLRDVRSAGASRLLHWHPDDYRNPANATPEFLAAIPAYDACITPKTHNVPELREDGARRVVFMPYSWDPEVHRPADPRPPVARTACFVGDRERERATLLRHLVVNRIDLEVWGPNWWKLAPWDPLRRRCTLRVAPGDAMARIFASARFSLGFLRRVNRDCHTARTFEIPACGGLMLTERSDEQRAFFEEDVEALYFEGAEELLEKIRVWGARPADLERIRAAALDRCRRSRYRYQDRVEDLLRELELPVREA